jgi:uncharacterized membrane protein
VIGCGATHPGMETESLPTGLDPVRAYLAGVGAAVLALVGGSVLFTEAVYARFLWQYFWGPVYADANNAACAVWNGGERTLLGSAECATAEGIVAVPGYTVVSEIGYALTLVVAVVGVVLLLRRLDLGESMDLFWGLLPFMFLGGALRVVEDATNAAAAAGVDPALTYPANSVLISPVIYFTLFALALASLLVSVRVEQARDVAYWRVLAAIGGALLALTLSWLLYLAVTTDYVYLLPQFTVVVLAVAGVCTVAIYRGIEAFRPRLHAGTGTAGAVLVFGHAVDGTANVVGLDWGAELGYPTGDLVGKHPVNRAVVDFTAAYVPDSVTAVVGDAWPFLLLKLVVVVVVLAIFDDTVFEDSPRYAVLMLVAVLAVGLGPGTRDMLRATFGI